MMVESSCAVPFALDKPYLVYASRVEDGGFLVANACGGTGTLTNAGEDLEALGPPTERLPETGGPAVHPLGLMVVGTITFLLLVAALASSLRQRSQPRR